MIEEITSTKNSKILLLDKLKKASVRKKEGLIVIEGINEINLALKSEIEPRTLFCCQEVITDNTILDNMDQKFVIFITKEIFKKVSYRESRDGYLLVAKTPQIKLEDIKVKENPLIIILESVEKPGNLGAVLRTADAIAADLVIICDPVTDIYNPNAIRASIGTVFTNKVVSCTNEEAFKWLEQNKIKTFATTPDTEKVYTDSDFTQSSAIVVGTEHDGLSDEWLNHANEKIKIEMNGQADSLNASVSAAVVLFEAKRQRK